MAFTQTIINIPVEMRNQDTRRFLKIYIEKFERKKVRSNENDRKVFGVEPS